MPYFKTSMLGLVKCVNKKPLAHSPPRKWSFSLGGRCYCQKRIFLNSASQRYKLSAWSSYYNAIIQTCLQFTSRKMSAEINKKGAHFSFEMKFRDLVSTTTIYYILCVDISVIKPWIKIIPVKWYDIISLSEMISCHFTGLNCPIK